MHCPSCGNNVADDHDYCDLCGASLRSPSSGSVPGLTTSVVRPKPAKAKPTVIEQGGDRPGLSSLPVGKKEYSVPVFATLPKVSPKKARRAAILSHWAKLFYDLQVSPREFYSCVEEAIHSRQIPDAKNCRVDWEEGGIVSANREYLRIERGELAFDICAAPFGSGFFVSSWLVSPVAPVGLITFLMVFVGLVAIAFVSIRYIGIVLGSVVAATAVPLALFHLIDHWNRNRPGWDFYITLVPVIGPIYEKLFHPFTYYKIDTALMFHQAVHNALMEVINGMRKAKGLRALTELEQKPVMRKFFQM